MADEMSADEKAEMALRLWEALTMKLLRAGVISTDTTDSIISREFGDHWESAGIMQRLEAMTRRFHGLPDAVPGGDQPREP